MVPTGDLDDKDAPSLLIAEADSYSKLRKRGHLQIAKCITTAFKKTAAAYFNQRSREAFSHMPYTGAR